jgi:hypothetical protein
MTYQEINQLIESLSVQLDMPYAYYQFDEETAPPFIVFNFPNSDDFYADNVNYQEKTVLDIYFCSDEKDFKTEQAIEAFLTAHDISYSKTQSYINEEKMWQIDYETEVFINA